MVGVTLTSVGRALTRSIELLVSAITLTNVRSYEDLTVHLFGRKMGVFVEVNILLTLA